MKKVFALLLACVMLFSFAACGETPAPTVQPEPEPAPSEPVQTEPEPAAPAEPEPAAEPEPEQEPEPEVLSNIPVDKETAVQALYTVVKAYFNKNPYTQYEGKSMSIEGKWPGPQRIHHYAPPEYASADQAHFSQCTDYVSTLYYQAFGYEFMDGLNAPPTDTMMKKLTADDGLIYYRDDVTDANVQEVIKEYRAMLEPGDFIISNGETGHALMWLGDFYGDGSHGGTNYSIILDVEITKDSEQNVTRVTGYSFTPIYTVTGSQSPESFSRVVRIEQAMQAHDGNFVDKITDACYADMTYSLTRIASRTSGKG